MKSFFFIVVSAVVSVSLFAGVREERSIRYAEGKRCVLDLRIPQNAKSFPVVVWFHGGGLENGNRHFVPIDASIAQVAVGYRLLGGEAASGKDCVEDAAAAVAWTFRNIGRYGGDTNRIFVAGISAGGYLTMMAGMNPAYLARHGIRRSPGWCRFPGRRRSISTSENFRETRMRSSCPRSTRSHRSRGWVKIFRRFYPSADSRRTSGSAGARKTVC